MIIDSQNLYGSGVALSGGTADLTNVIDHSQIPHKIEKLRFYGAASSDAADGVSVQLVLEESDAAGGTYTTVVEGPVVPIADINAGIPLLNLSGIAIRKQFSKASIVVVGTFTAGTVMAGLGIIGQDGEPTNEAS